MTTSRSRASFPRPRAIRRPRRRRTRRPDGFGRRVRIGRGGEVTEGRIGAGDRSERRSEGHTIRPCVPRFVSSAGSGSLLVGRAGRYCCPALPPAGSPLPLREPRAQRFRARAGPRPARVSLRPRGGTATNLARRLSAWKGRPPSSEWSPPLAIRGVPSDEWGAVGIREVPSERMNSPLENREVRLRGLPVASGRATPERSPRKARYSPAPDPSAQADITSSMPRFQSPRPEPGSALRLRSRPRPPTHHPAHGHHRPPDVYTLSHAVCGRGWARFTSPGRAPGEGPRGPSVEPPLLGVLARQAHDGAVAAHGDGDVPLQRDVRQHVRGPDPEPPLVRADAARSPARPWCRRRRVAPSSASSRPTGCRSRRTPARASGGGHADGIHLRLHGRPLRANRPPIARSPAAASCRSRAVQALKLRNQRGQESPARARPPLRPVNPSGPGGRTEARRRAGPPRAGRSRPGVACTTTFESLHPAAARQAANSSRRFINALREEWDGSAGRTNAGALAAIGTRRGFASGAPGGAAAGVVDGDCAALAPAAPGRGAAADPAAHGLRQRLRQRHPRAGRGRHPGRHRRGAHQVAAARSSSSPCRRWRARWRRTWRCASAASGRSARRAQPGDSARNTGAVILVSMQDRKWRVETGIGTNTFITAAEAGRIGRDLMVPRLQAGRPGQGILAAVQGLAQEYAEEFSFTLQRRAACRSRATSRTRQTRRARRGGGGGGGFIFFLILIFILFSILRGGGGGGGRAGGGAASAVPVIIPFPMGGGGGGWGGGGFGGGRGRRVRRIRRWRWIWRRRRGRRLVTTETGRRCPPSWSGRSASRGRCRRRIRRGPGVGGALRLRGAGRVPARACRT